MPEHTIFISPNPQCKGQVLRFTSIAVRSIENTITNNCHYDQGTCPIVSPTDVYPA